jgi:hypothetical protein
VNVPLSAIVALGAVVVLVVAAVVARGVWSGSSSAPYRLAGAIAQPTRENRVLPDRVQCPKDGRLADGQTDGPLPKTNYTPGAKRPLDGLFAPGQVVAFEFLVQAQDSAPLTGSLDFEVSWPKATQRTPGFDPDQQVVCAFVDHSDPSSSLKGTPRPTAKFTRLPPTQDTIRASFALQGLARNDTAVVEVWLVATKDVPDTNGTLETRIDNAKADAGAKVDIQQGVVNYRMNFFDRQEDPNLTLNVDDSQPTGRDRNKYVDYAITIANTARTAIAPAARLDAFLDKQTKLDPTHLQVTDTEGSITSCAPTTNPDPALNGFTCNLGFVNPGETVKILARVSLLPGVETKWTKHTPGCTDLVDICGRFVLSYKQTAGSDPAQVRLEQPSDIPSDQPLTIAKLVPVAPYAYPGQKVVFTYRVANGGQSGSYNQVRVTDTSCKDITGPKADPNNNGKLDPGESWDFECTISQVASDATTSESRVEAITDDGKPVQASAITKITLISPKLAVAVTPQPDTPSARAVSVTAAGDAPITDIAITAQGCGGLTQTSAGDGDKILKPGQTWNYSCAIDSKADPKAQITVRAYGLDPLLGAVTDAKAG